MELYFMPSDVARIVLGYLKESTYVKTYNCFLKECGHLKEIYNLEKAGRSLKKVTQFNLVKILEEWGQYRYSNENSVAGGNNFTETPSSDETVDDTLVCDNDVTDSGRKTKGRARSSSKKSPQISKARRPCTPKSFKIRLKSPRNTKNISNENRSPEKPRSDKTAEKAITGNFNKGKPCEFTPKKSMIPSHRENSAGKSVVQTSPFSTDKSKQTDIGRNAHTEVSDAVNNNCMKTSGIDCDRTKATVQNNDQVDTDESDVNNDKQGKGEEVLEGKISKSGMLENKIECTNQSEPKHRKTEETFSLLTEDEKCGDISSTKVKILSETFIKTTVEPPTESVGSCEDKCLAWMNKNESETTNTESDICHNKITNNIDKESTDDHEKTLVREKLGQNDNVHDEEKVQEHLSTHTDESSNEVTTSKSSDTVDTRRSNTPGVAASTFNASEQGRTIPQHITPKKMSPPGSKDKSLVTPVKFLLTSEHHLSRSPRRKKPKTPRKRTSEVSPVSVVSTKSVDPASVNPIFEKILTDHRLHEKLAETCNLVHSQIKLANSGKENKSDTRLGEHISPVPIHHSYEQETITASRSLEEILGIDHNFHTEMLSDNIDMSDPAYESLFKLFGTDRETFNEYLRKEKEKELALMEAEVEELERSNHEIMCANFGVSQADAGYETQELAYSSPHHIPLGSQDLFTTQQTSHSPRTGHATSTPCGNGVPINFTPLLRGSELGSSPVHSAASVLGGLKNTGVDNKISPCSTATQPFSPAFSHYSEVNNPPTPRNQKHLSTYVNENSPVGTTTPGSHVQDPYSNPATPMQPDQGQIMHSTPTGPGSVRSHRNADHFHHSSPIHSQHSAVKNTHAPVHCSPLVKADIHPDSPLLTQTDMYQSSSNNGLYFNSHITSGMANQNGHDFANNGCVAQTENFSEPASGYLNLLNEAAHIATSREPCTTIENTIGCISLPQPTSIESKSNNKKKGASRSRRKKEPVKRNSVSASHATVKSLLEKPLTHLNSIPLSMKVADLQRVYRTPEKRIPVPAENLTFPSPGGKTLINVPLLNCEDQIDLSVLGMDENIDGAGPHTVNVYDQNLDSSTQYSIAPENQATHELANAIKAGKTAEVAEQIRQIKNDKTKQKASKRSNTERKRTKKKKEESGKNEQHEKVSPTTSLDRSVQQEGNLDPNQDMYTATPFTSLNKAATVRALNFGPNVDDPNIAHYRKIYPKLQTPSDTSPSVLILNTNQVINPGQRVIVNTTPVTLVKNINGSSVQKDPKGNIKKEQNSETENIGASESKDSSDTEHPVVKRVTRSETSRRSKDSAKEVTEENIKKFDTDVDLDFNTCEETSEGEIHSPKPTKNILNETPRKVKQSPRQTRNLSKELTEDIGTEFSDGASNEEINADKSEFKNNLESKLNTVKNSEENFEKKKTVKIDIKCKKKDSSPKRTRNKGSKGKEKLKVKIPIVSHRSPNGKGRSNKFEKSVIPFYFKKKADVKSDANSSDEDVPLSVVRQQQIKVKKKDIEKENSVEIIIESETTDEEKSTENTQSVTNKAKEWSDDDQTTSKEMLFEKIGLTPTKSLGKHDLKSPNRANALDVLAEWQSSPLSSRSRGLTPNSCNRFSKADDCLKSPTTPRRRTPAKQLFGSPIKGVIDKVKGGKAKQTSKRVDSIIDRLKQNNPDRNLCSANTNKAKIELKIDENSEVSVQEVKQGSKNLKQNKNKIKGNKNKKTDGENKSFNTENVINDQGDGTVSNIVDKKMSEVDKKKYVAGDYEKTSATEHVDDQVVTADGSILALDENSHGFSELNRAIASIAMDHPTTKGKEEQNLPFNQYKETELHGYNMYQSEEILSESDNTKNESIEISKTDYSKNEVSGEQYKSAFSEKQDCKDQTDIHNKHIVSVDVHAAENSQDSCEMIENFKDHQSDSQSLETCYKDIEINQLDGVTHSHDKPAGSDDIVEVGTVNTEQVESKRREKRKKRKHRPCHRHKHEGNVDVNNIGDQFVPPSQGEREHHHKKKKKKKSKKRHREDSEDTHESKRRRKEKTSVSLDSLAALNVDEALSQIYGKQSAT